MQGDASPASQKPGRKPATTLKTRQQNIFQQGYAPGQRVDYTLVGKHRSGKVLGDASAAPQKRARKVATKEELRDVWITGWGLLPGESKSLEGFVSSQCVRGPPSKIY